MLEIENEFNFDTCYLWIGKNIRVGCIDFVELRSWRSIKSYSNQW